MGDAAHQGILDVEAGEAGLAELVPRNAGLKDAVAPRLSRIRADGRRLRFRVSERCDVSIVARRGSRAVTSSLRPTARAR